MKVAVLGAGSWGTTLALVLVANAHEITLWTFRDDQAHLIRERRENPSFLPGIPIPESIHIETDIERAVFECSMIVCAVPAQYLRSAITPFAGVDCSNTAIVNVAKGIENSSLMTMSEVLLDVLKRAKSENIVTLSGPSHAEEVSKRIPSAVVSASVSAETARLVQSAFMTPFLRVYVSEDIRGVELGGALKNVIAVGAGIGDGSGFGDNTKAAIMTRGIVEITRLGVAMNAQPKTFWGLSGIGDLIVTCMSRHSRNRYVGEQVGKGKPLDEVLKGMEMVAEGVATTKSAYNLAQRYRVTMPITEEVHQVLFEGKDPFKATNDLMTRHAKGEE